jgi:multidrug efflux pump subunit AcrB
MSEFRHQANLLGAFAEHRVAANLLMIIMIMSGVWALIYLNTQFFPSFTLETINVRVIWRGASAEDVEDGLTDRIEEALRTQENLREITSTSAEGVASISLEFESGTDMSRSLDQVKEKVALIRDLPEDIEEPEITRVTMYDRVARVLVWSENDPRALPILVQQYERELLDRGIANIELDGLPEQEIAIQLKIEDLQEMSMSLDQLGRQVGNLSTEAPAGNINRDQLSQQLRSPEKIKAVEDYKRIPISTGGNTLLLGDIAQIQRRERQNQTSLTYQGHPAIEMRLLRIEGHDTLESARILDKWLQDTQPSLPPGVGIKVYDQRWQYIQQRINLLLENGFTGLVLVVIILFIFLRGPVAFWVAVGIPVSFMMALAALYVAGGSINMVSLFGLIMALGIIVDDAIVVGEDAMTHYQMGEAPLSAAEGGAWRMFAPVMSSSLTTIAAFVPLMMLGGTIGKWLFAIPLVVICVIIASLIESFLVLPGHLRRSFERIQRAGEVSGRRQKIEQAFDKFRNGRFRHWVEKSIAHPWQTLMIAFAIVIITVGLLAGKRIPFTFLPTTESSLISVNIQFTAGTPRHVVQNYLSGMEHALDKLDEQHPGLIQLYSSRLGQSLSSHGRSTQKGDRYASIMIELSDSDTRDIRNPAFIRMLRERVPQPPALENLLITSRQSGPGGRDLTFQLTGQSPSELKRAAEELADVLKNTPSVFSVEDDMPYGQTQLVYELSPQGKSLGITTQEIGRQLRAAYDGYIVQIFQDGYDEIEVRTILSDEQRNGFTTLESLPIMLADGMQAALGSLVDFKYQRGFEILRHENGRLAVEVSADIDEAQGNANDITQKFLDSVLPEIASRHNVRFEATGKAADQQETISEMMIGSFYALALIYLILAWIFSSYGWPLVVMAIIPFAIVGAILGHWLTGINLTILSLFGLFGLAGIVVNDSIILVTFYRQLRKEGMPRQQAIVEASVRRLRAVLLTSLTTIAGLIPLLFETSLQAQFLIPMATSIAFGLGFSTLLVLFLVPLLLNAYEAMAEKLSPRNIEIIPSS